MDDQVWTNLARAPGTYLSTDEYHEELERLRTHPDSYGVVWHVCHIGPVWIDPLQVLNQVRTDTPQLRAHQRERARTGTRLRRLLVADETVLALDGTALACMEIICTLTDLGEQVRVTTAAVPEVTIHGSTVLSPIPEGEGGIRRVDPALTDRVRTALEPLWGEASWVQQLDLAETDRGWAAHDDL